MGKPEQKTTPILGGKYEVIGVKPGKIGTKFGVIDLSTIDEATAEMLVKAKSSYIRKVEAKKEKEAEPKSDKK